VEPPALHGQPRTDQMEQRSLASKFAQLRLPRLVQAAATDRLVRLRPRTMDHLVADFNTALDESVGSNSSSRSTTSRRKAWKRRCKSTSNLLGGGAGAGAGGRMSEDSSSSVDNLALLSRERGGTSSLQFSDSDIESAVAAGQALVRSVGRTKRGRADVMVESDSFTENIQPWGQFRGQSKRKRKFKRMAVCGAGPGGEAGPVTTVRMQGGVATKRKKVRSRSGLGVGGACRERRACPPGPPGTAVTGKRKRSAREKSEESGELLAGPPLPGAGGEERMELEEVGSSSSLSSSEWEDLDSCHSPGEADDEQSDWPGHAELPTDDESCTADPEVFLSRRAGRDGRPIRAGSRRPGPATGSPYGETVHRFVQDPGRSTLRLVSVGPAERTLLVSLARLYCLRHSVEGGAVVLTKTVAVASLPAAPLGADQFTLPAPPPGPAPPKRELAASALCKRQRRYGPGGLGTPRSGRHRGPPPPPGSKSS